MAISTITKGEETIVPAWKPNKSTTVARSPMIEKGLSAPVKRATASPS